MIWTQYSCIFTYSKRVWLLDCFTEIISLSLLDAPSWCLESRIRSRLPQLRQGQNPEVLQQRPESAGFHDSAAGQGDLATAIPIRDPGMKESLFLQSANVKPILSTLSGRFEYSSAWLVLTQGVPTANTQRDRRLEGAAELQSGIDVAKQSSASPMASKVSIHSRRVRDVQRANRLAHGAPQLRGISTTNPT